MTRLIALLLISSVLFQTVHSLSCFQGVGPTYSLKRGFDYCVIMVDMTNEDILYDGLTGKTSVFDRDEWEEHRGDCFFEHHKEVTYAKCYCREMKCNRPITLKEFKQLFFSEDLQSILAASPYALPREKFNPRRKGIAEIKDLPSNSECSSK